MDYRKDINGLRAFAVIGVVVFHFFNQGLAGGFAGVDVFFVISGFLMTSIIFKGLLNNNFSILGFYKSRARRIVPALTVLCLILLCFGLAYLHPDDLKKLSKHIIGSLGFISNFMYWKESGYFDEASREKWLLHTWSLSVEWQFYILYPVILVILGRVFSRNMIRYILLSAAILMYVACVFATTKWPSPAYFLLPSRAWEMLAGGLVFLFPITRLQRFKVGFEPIGILLVLFSYFFFSEKAPWPGYLGLVPVIGACLVVWGQERNSHLTGNTIFQWIGKVSYSIYLWHWPIVVLINYMGLNQDYLAIFSGILATIILGALSFHLVESRFDRRAQATSNPSWGVLKKPVLYLMVLTFGVVTFAYGGFNTRLDPRLLEVTRNVVMPNRDNSYCFFDFNNTANHIASDAGLKCPLGDRSKAPKVLLFGDSFAGQYEPFWDQLGKSEGFAINSVTTNWCQPAYSKSFFVAGLSNESFKQCLLNRHYLLTSADQYDVVVFGAFWSQGLGSSYLDEVITAIKDVASKVHTVIIMPSPTIYDTDIQKRFQRDLFYKTSFDVRHYTKEKDKNMKLAEDKIREATAGIQNIIFPERNTIFSSEDIYQNGAYSIPYSLDGSHISLEGSLAAASHMQNSDYYKKVLRPLLP